MDADRIQFDVSVKQWKPACVFDLVAFSAKVSGCSAFVKHPDDFHHRTGRAMMLNDSLLSFLTLDSLV